MYTPYTSTTQVQRRHACFIDVCFVYIYTLSYTYLNITEIEVPHSYVFRFGVGKSSIYTYIYIYTYLGAYILAHTTRNICASMSDGRFNNIIIMIMHPREILPRCYAHAYDTAFLMTAMSASSRRRS